MRTLRPQFLAVLIALVFTLVGVEPGTAATSRAVLPETYLAKRIKHYRTTTVRPTGVLISRRTG